MMKSQLTHHLFDSVRPGAPKRTQRRPHSTYWTEILALPRLGGDSFYTRLDTTLL